MKELLEKLLLEEDNFEDEVEDTETPEDAELETETEPEVEEPVSDDVNTDTKISHTASEFAEITTYKVTFTLGSHTNWSRVDASSKEEAEQIVTDYVTKKWADRDFECQGVEEFKEEEMAESLNESLNEDAHGTFSDRINKYLQFLIDNDMQDDIPYLVEQLIRYCKEDDLKDLWFDRLKQVSYDNGFEKEEIDEAMEIGYSDSTIQSMIQSLEKGIEDYKQLIIDEPEDKEYWEERIQVCQNEIDELKSYKPMNESLTDAQPIETGAAVGMASVINNLIKDEYEAIEGYNSAIATAEAEGFGDMVNVLAEIQAEENLHIGQLQAVMNTIDPNAHLVNDGQQEGVKQLAGIEDNVEESLTEDLDTMNEQEQEMFVRCVNEVYKMSVIEWMQKYHEGNLEINKVNSYSDIPNTSNLIEISATDISQGTGNVVVYTYMNAEDGSLYSYADF